MKTLLSLFLSLIVLLFASCEKPGIEISTHVDLTLLNAQGHNLLAPPAVYVKDDINIYYVINGQAQLYNEPKLDYNKGFKIINEGVSRIRIFLNYDIKGKERTALTLIKLGTAKIDTIKGEFEYTNRSVFLRKIWFNGALKSHEFTIVK
ncbi:hypothetical protein FQZ97_959540 [compost metagenome]